MFRQLDEVVVGDEFTALGPDEGLVVGLEVRHNEVHQEGGHRSM